MTPDDLLRGAIEIIERDGWHQKDYHQHPDIIDIAGIEKPTMDDWRYQGWLAERTAPVCALGAINRARGGTATETAEDSAAWDGAVKRLAAVVAGTRCHSEIVIPKWNDDPNTSKEDVLLAFKRALDDA
ncbi:hypothetical protein [Streptomyces sp. NPDC015131]|uniref:DUF6197 family protein n=1 Tax=Streptomyces sp. NPDC015131 TaxID=3364941 RepID=UPI0037020440